MTQLETEGSSTEQQTATVSPSDEGLPSKSTKETAACHELQTPWTFWYDRKVRVSYSSGSGGRKESDMLMDSAHYAKNLKEIHTFETVEEFYRAFAFIKKPSELPTDFNISLFRRGSKPMWEVSDTFKTS
ncbi:uncharacterized protein LOC129618215 [Condylostylus longicornis]|uniref:uncharacterized protein LOC129618215 n=1 Tax=Condylostylus longicornis TaxID=2530218 RepID=UPI00244E30A9|nr:uncharacterized protein LOC129618215 [Condylostylus longicornis]